MTAGSPGYGEHLDGDNDGIGCELPPSGSSDDADVPVPVDPPVEEPPVEVPVEEEPPASDPYFENCDAARAAGAAPLYVGDPGYRSALDRDDDGVACE